LFTPRRAVYTAVRALPHPFQLRALSPYKRKALLSEGRFPVMIHDWWGEPGPSRGGRHESHKTAAGVTALALTRHLVPCAGTLQTRLTCTLHRNSPLSVASSPRIRLRSSDESGAAGRAALPVRPLISKGGDGRRDK
jgi:hypothetical protein